MNWYIAKIIYQVISGEGEHTPQFDEQFRLIRADETAWAWEKASVIARMEQSLFLNSKREEVQWKFIAVEDVSMIESLEDGTQCYAQTIEPYDAEEYVMISQSRAKRFFSLEDKRILPVQ